MDSHIKSGQLYVHLKLVSKSKILFVTRTIPLKFFKGSKNILNQARSFSNDSFLVSFSFSFSLGIKLMHIYRIQVLNVLTFESWQYFCVTFQSSKNLKFYTNEVIYPSQEFYSQGGWGSTLQWQCPMSMHDKKKCVRNMIGDYIDSTLQQNIWYFLKNMQIVLQPRICRVSQITLDC